MDAIAESSQESSAGNKEPSTSTMNDSFQSPKSLSLPVIQRFPSMDNISKKGGPKTNGSVSSRRTASWSGENFNDSFSSLRTGEIKPLNEALGMPPSTFMPDESLVRPPLNSGNFGDLHEVEL